MNVTDKLNQWKTQTPNSEVSTKATIYIKTPTMNVSVEGPSMEDAYSQLESIFKQKQEEHKTDATPFQQNTTPPAQTSAFTAPAPTQQTVPQASLNNTFPAGKLPPEFNGKSILRIYSPGQPLNPGESTVFFNNLTYVVK